MDPTTTNTAPSARAYLVATAGIIAWAGESPERVAWIARCVTRHFSADWGDVDKEDWATNDRSRRLRDGRLVSVYRAADDLDPVDANVWITTDDLAYPDAPTTVLWPSEY